MNLQNLYKKYKDIFWYAFFGICTTLVNLISYWIFARIFFFGTMISTIFAWLSAVLFAYWTNRIWVFHSTASSVHDILNELTKFFTCRIATGIVDWGCMFLFVDVLRFNDLFIKLIANIIVIILNYAASKLIIFRKK